MWLISKGYLHSILLQKSANTDWHIIGRASREYFVIQGNRLVSECFFKNASHIRNHLYRDKV